MIDCLSLTPYQGWDKHSGARVRLICHFQIPLLRPSIIHCCYSFTNTGWGTIKTQTEVNEPRGSRCSWFDTMCVHREALFFLVLHCCELNEVSHWHRNSLWIIQLQKTTISRGTVGVLQVVKWKQNCKCILIEARCFAPPICNGERWSLSQVIVKTAISICRCEKCFSAPENLQNVRAFFRRVVFAQTGVDI